MYVSAVTRTRGTIGSEILAILTFSYWDIRLLINSKSNAVKVYRTLVIGHPVDFKPHSGRGLFCPGRPRDTGDLLAQASKSLSHANRINEWKKGMRK